MAKKKKTTKLDATVRMDQPGFKFAHTLPEYTKPRGSFIQAFVPGAFATIWRRRWDQKKLIWYLDEIECLLIGKEINCFYYEDDDGKKHGCPWWAIHNYEVYDDNGEEEPDSSKAGGEDQRPEEQGHRGGARSDERHSPDQEPADL